jgi:hypothetical protein
VDAKFDGVSVGCIFADGDVWVVAPFADCGSYNTEVICDGSCTQVWWE